MASYNPFDTLPIETNQHIASFLEYDEDVCNFALICQSTANAVEADGCSFWRRRFLSQYEKPSWTQPNNLKYKQAYQRRRMVLKNGAIFKQGDGPKERRCLEHLRDLIVDSFSSNKASKDLIYESLNVQHIKRFLLANNLLQIVCKPHKKTATGSKRKRDDRHDSLPSNPSALLLTIQVLCAPMLLSFESHILNHHFSYPDSQLAVYSNTATQPIFGGYHGLDINMPFVLHNLNFWKYHMVREAEVTLYHPFSELEPDERPRWWSTQLRQGCQTLGKHWKGTYAYIEREDLAKLRRPNVDEDENELIHDQFAGEDMAFSFQDMKLECITDPTQALPWPKAFEEQLRSLTPPPATHAKTRAQKRCAAPSSVENFKPLSFRFDGEGQDVEEAFLASGWMNPLPPQQEVPGWQRVTMMKYFEDEEGGGEGSVDENALWAYEGVMLPGGQIMLGRWWSVSPAEEDMYSGPFILWCVDGARYEALDGERENGPGSA